MEIESFAEVISLFFGQHKSHLAITLLIAVVYVVIDRISIPRLEEGVDEGGFKEGTIEKAVRIARLIIGLVGLLVIALVWGVKFSSIFVFAGTTLTLLGVALFASWSILSNVTSYFILLLHPSFRRGYFVRVIDVDNYAEGYIAELSLFNTKLITENREIIVYPNNLLLSRPAIINPRDRLNIVGKLPLHKESDDLTQ